MFISYGDVIFDEDTGDVFEREHYEEEEVEYDPWEKFEREKDYEAERDEGEFWDELAREEALEDERLIREYEARS